MHITLAGGNKEAKHKKPVQKRFDKLLELVEREDRSLNKLRTTMEDLARQYFDHLRETDEQHLDGLIALAERLATLASRKSLSNWHRDELLDWFSELCARIGPLDPERLNGLSDAYNTSIASLSGLTFDELQQQIAERMNAAAPDQESEPEAADPMPDEHDALQDDLFGFDDVDDPFENDPTPDEDNPSDIPFPDLATPDAGQELVNADWIKRLFRRTAQQLHPDREADPKARALKQQRMSDLLQARRDGDVITLLRIYGQTLGEESMQLAETQMQALCEALESRLSQLEMEKFTYLASDPHRATIYETLYSPSKAQRQKKLKQWRTTVSDVVASEVTLLSRLRNLQGLKQELSDRYDRYRRVGFDLPDFADWD